MSSVLSFENIRCYSAAWLDVHGMTVLQYSLATIMMWFGILKPFSMSPAEPIVRQAIFFLPHELFFPFLGLWEAVIGVGLLFDRTVRISVFMLVFQMLGTMIPLVVTPVLTFTMLPLAPSKVGLFIIKNWVLLSGGLVVARSVQTDPHDHTID